MYLGQSNGLCAQADHCVFAVRMKKPWVLSNPMSAQRRLWSDWADAQADLSLRWAHTHFVGFVMSWLNYEVALIISYLVLFVLILIQTLVALGISSTKGSSTSIRLVHLKTKQLYSLFPYFANTKSAMICYECKFKDKTVIFSLSLFCEYQICYDLLWMYI